jgi:arylsulfatase A-like enzyme
MHVKAAVLFGTIGGALLGLLETVIVILHYLGGPISFWKVGSTVLVTPLLVYALVSFTASLLIGAALGLVPGTFPGRIRDAHAVVRLYTALFYVPIVILSLYLWRTRVFTGDPLFSVRSTAHGLALAIVFFGVHRVVRAAVLVAVRKRATLFTRIAIVLALLILLLVMKGIWSIRRDRGGDVQSVSAGGEVPLSVLLITMDTQRADFLRIYGDTLTLTPALDSLAAGGTVFLDASAQVPMTLPSHVSILTSTYPSVHGIRTNAEPRKLPGSMRTVTEILREQGYRTGAFVSAFVLSSFTEASRGFEVYDDQFEDKGLHYLARIKPRPTLVEAMEWAGITLSRHFERRAEATTTRAIRWLDRVPRDEPFFLWVHYFDPHSYYAPPAPYDGLYTDTLTPADGTAEAVMEVARTYFPKQGDHVELGPDALLAVRALYRGETSYMDHHIGRLIGRLRETGRLERTLIVATADHGETLGEHDTLGHSMWVYRPILHVPLLFWCPGRVPAGVVRREVVQSIDIMPTILDILGIPPPGQVQGRSLVPFFTGEETPSLSAYFETFKPEPQERRMVGYRLGPWKYVYTPWGEEEYLFHLGRDPGETENLVGEEPEIAARLRERADAIMNAGESLERGEAIEMTPEGLEALRALGYIK